MPLKALATLDPMAFNQMPVNVVVAITIAAKRKINCR